MLKILFSSAIVAFKQWGIVKKIAILLSFLTIISAMPIFLYSNTCTYGSISYLNPFGISFETQERVGGLLFPGNLCGQSFTYDIFGGHFLLADLTIFSWIIYFIFSLRKGRRLIS